MDDIVTDKLITLSWLKECLKHIFGFKDGEFEFKPMNEEDIKECFKENTTADGEENP